MVSLCRSLLCVGVLGVACRASAPVKPAAAPTGVADTGVEKSRGNLQITPWELFFSGVRGVAKSSEFVGIKNISAAEVQITGLAVSGDESNTFRLHLPPVLPYLLPPGQQLSVEISFAPPADAKPLVHRAALKVGQGEGGEDFLLVDLSGLVAVGQEGEKEPPLAQVVEALGYSVNVGGKQLRLGTGADPIGEEVRSQRFVRVKASPVGVYAVARYSPNERLPFGYYTGDAASPALHELGAIANGQFQTLNPELDPDGKTSFDAGDQPFGLFVKSGKHATFSEDQLNTGQVKHAVRVYPLKSRGGGAVPETLLVCFEEAANGDYNDYVFLLVNARPAGP